MSKAHFLAIALLFPAFAARGLDKQGSAHGGAVQGDASGFDFSGAALLGVSFYNPSYAARPDNTGLALMRYAAHADMDLVGRRLSVPLDVNVFSDRTRGGLAVLLPTELDLIAGLTSTWGLGPTAVEVGIRVEHDRPVDRGDFSQTYGDVRARLLYALGDRIPALAHALQGGDVSGWLTLGWFSVNPSYAARPDNSGRALMRYGAHAEVSAFDDLVSVALDATMFTDRFASSPLRPSELDLTPELIFRRAPYELHVAYEHDAPLDREGLTQSFAYVLGAWAWDLAGDEAPPFENRGQPLSP